MTLRTTWLSLCVMAAVSSTSFADQPYQLRYRFQSGQFTHYEVTDRAEMLTQYAEQQSKSVQQTQMLKSYRVVAVDENGGATIEPIVEITRMASQSGDKPPITYDSVKDKLPPKEFEMIAGTIGRPLARFQLSATGKLMKVTMLSTDVPKSLADAASKTDPLMNFLTILPEKPVKIGDKWSESYEVQVGVGNGLSQSIKMMKSYELSSVEGNIANITFRTGLITPVSDPEILRQLVQLTPTGTVEFDIQQGQLLSRKLKIDERVVDAFGSKSLLQAEGESVEKLVPPQLAKGIPNQIPK